MRRLLYILLLFPSVLFGQINPPIQPTVRPSIGQSIGGTKYDISLEYSPLTEFGDSLRLWLDATDDTTFVLNGIKVAQWKDKSSYQHDAYQTTDARRPDLDSLNDWIDFVPGSQEYLLDSFLTFNLVQPYTIIIVGRTENTSVKLTDGIDASNRPQIGNSVGSFYMNAGTILNTYSPPDTNWHIMMAEFMGASSAATFDAGTRRGYHGNAGTQGAAGITIGANYLKSGSFLDGKISEIIVIDDSLTYDQWVDMNNYLGEKYSTVTPLQAELDIMRDELVGTITPGEADVLNEFLYDVKTALDVDLLSERADLFYVTSGETQEESLQDLASNSYPLTVAGSPTFTADKGFSNFSTSNYLKTSWQPLSDAVHFGYNGGSIGGFVTDTIVDATQFILGSASTSSGTRKIQLNPKYTNEAFFDMATASNTSDVNYSWDAGMYAGIRVNSDSASGYINSVRVLYEANDTAILPDLETYIGVRNLNGSANGPISNTISLVWVGDELTEDEYIGILAAHHKYITAKGHQVMNKAELTFRDSIQPTKVLELGVDLTGNNSYFRIPFIGVLNEDTVIVGAEGRYGSYGDRRRSDLAYTMSTDGGSTWSNGAVLIANNGVFTDPVIGSRVANGCFLRGYNRRSFVFASHIDTETISQYWGDTIRPPEFLWDFGYVYTEDGGQTWSSFQTLYDYADSSSFPGTNLILPANNNGIMMVDSTLVVPLMYARRSTNMSESGTDWAWRCGLLVSDDNGDTWDVSNMIEAFTDEPAIVEYDTGRIVLSSRNIIAETRTFYTDDLGDTWSVHPRDKYEEIVPTEFAYNRLVYNDQVKYLLSCPKGSNRFDMRLRESDDMITWRNAVQLFKGTCNGYSGIASTLDGSQLFVTIEVPTYSIDIWDVSEIVPILYETP